MTKHYTPTMVSDRQPELNDEVLFYNMSLPTPGPFAASILAINSDGTLDLTVRKPEGIAREYNVFSRVLTQTGRMWDWPRTYVNGASLATTVLN